MKREKEIETSKPKQVTFGRMKSKKKVAKYSSLLKEEYMTIIFDPRQQMVQFFSKRFKLYQNELPTD